MKPETAWRVETWIGQNCPTILYGILSVAVFLQQFPVTEPLTFGFWWITIISFFGGAILAGMFFYPGNPRSLYTQMAVTLLGVALQIYLVAFHWQTLVWMDNGLRLFRGMLINSLLGREPDFRTILWWFHLVPGWIIWGSLTCYALKRVLADGCFFFAVRKRAW